MIASEWEFVVDPAEFRVRRNEYRLDVSTEASNTPRSEELGTTQTDGTGDSELTDVSQSLMAIEVGSVNTERELSGRKRLGGRYKPQAGVAEVSR